MGRRSIKHARSRTSANSRLAHSPVFRLYIAGRAPNSTRAIYNLNVLRDAYPDYFRNLEVIDVLVAPLRALTDGILVTPTLVKVSPPPLAKILGDLSDSPTLLATLGLNLTKK